MPSFLGMCLVLQVSIQGVNTNDVLETKENIQEGIETSQQSLPNNVAKELLQSSPESLPQDNQNTGATANMPETTPQDGETLETTDDQTESSLSFPFGNLLRSIMDPMFETESDPDEISVEDIEEKVDTEVEKNETLDKNITTNNVVHVPLIDRDISNNKTEKKTKFKCTSRNMTLENITSEVKIINNTRLLQILNFEKNDTLSDCVLVMFFAPWCRFCSKVAPNYNALARAFPELDVVAVDAAHFSNLNARFGTVSVPNILLFHQSRAVVRFNQTDRQFENLITFVKNHTGMEPDTAVNVTEADFEGPLPSVPSDETDFLLWLSWLFVIVFISVVFVRSSYGQHYINKVKILWQEHQHID